MKVLRFDHVHTTRLLQFVIEYFPSFRDEHHYKGEKGMYYILSHLYAGNYVYKVFIWKRAQILIADLWACFGGTDIGYFEDIETITMFADYRVPQALLAIGAIEYEPVFLEYLTENNGHLESGEEREIEIRCCSIWAVEQIRRLLGNRHYSIILDFFLWDYAKKNSGLLQQYPIHKTRSIYY